VEDPTPGGGGRKLRKQLGIMKVFLERFDLGNGAENNAIVATTVPDGLRSEIRALSDRSRSSWGVYVPRGPSIELGLELPSRFYHVEWIDPRDGKVLKAEDLDARGGITRAPDYSREEIALARRAPGPLTPRAWSSALPTTLRTLQ